jgi:hypothetical protein
MIYIPAQDKMGTKLKQILTVQFTIADAPLQGLRLIY